MSMVDTIGFSLSLAQSGEEAEEKGLSFQLVPWPPCLSSAMCGSPSVQREEALPHVAMAQADHQFEAGHMEQAEGNDFQVHFSSSYHIIMMAFKLIVLGN